MRKLFPWMGSKLRLAQQIIDSFPPHRCYVEPFCGSAAVFFTKPRSKVEVLNDINGDLVTLFRCAQNHPEELFRQFRYLLASRRTFRLMQDQPPELLTDIQRAARFLYLQRTAFGGKVTGQTFGVSKTRPQKLNRQRLQQDLDAAHERLQDATIEHLSWRECIERYDSPETLVFVDPPYPGLAGYGVPFRWEDLAELRRVIDTMKGQAVITMRDSDEARKILDGLVIGTLTTSYSVGLGEKAKPAQELLIRTKREAA